ncbi:uncharacterized protein LOC108155475 [Drosophila miranda]|uniref:uncharacterized protein LOC108155475 n=1 Tax=Drosophila miranda TaxID=7229 RepID=UPI00143F33BA|nr:uncharacterized protein LOC108155475 [Drosophila miranda]
MDGNRHLRRLVKKERDEIARKLELLERPGVERENQRELDSAELVIQENNEAVQEDVEIAQDDIDIVQDGSKIRRLIFDAELFTEPVPEEQPISLSAEQRIMAAFKKTFSNLEKKVDVLSETLAEAVALLKLQITKEPDLSPNAMKFPIESTMELEHFNSIITPELTDFYINKLRNLMGTSTSMACSLKNVLDEKLILEYNLDGTSGKSSLKNCKEFYNVLESAVKMKIPNEPAEKVIRKAIHNIKNSHFQKSSRDRKYKALATLGNN